MRRHDFDPVSLFAGLVFLAIAGGYAVTHTTDTRLDWLAAVPAVLLLVGAAVTVGALRRIASARQPVVAMPAAGEATENTPENTDGDAAEPS
jgi:HAMP domain-containing protein